ncbi:MAG: glycerophosphodiester phosphodiesterase family protein [bacterium]
MKGEFSFACFMLFFFLFYKSLFSREVSMQIFGHRGACGYEVENSLSSFKKAIELGVDGIELDVYKCKSGELVVIHDDKIDRVTNGKGYVSDFTLDELKNFNLKNGEKIPTLNEVLDLINKRVVVDIELKGDGTGILVANLIKKYVQEKGWSYDNFLVTSFNQYELLNFSKQCGGVKIGAIISGIPIGYAQFAKDMNADFVVLSKSFINKNFIDDAHKKGLLVFVYTINDASDFEKIKNLNVDAIFSDYPDLNFVSF